MIEAMTSGDSAGGGALLARAECVRRRARRLAPTRYGFVERVEPFDREQRPVSWLDWLSTSASRSSHRYSTRTPVQTYGLHFVTRDCA